MPDEYLNILLVENKESAEKPILELLGHLQNEHFNIECVDGLDVASAKLADGDFQLVMLDFSEENGGGSELLNQLIDAAPGIPLLVFTKSNSDCARYSSVVKAGDCEFLPKERLKSEDILQSIRYLTSLERIRGPGGTANVLAQVSTLIQDVTEALDTPGPLEEMLQNCSQVVIDALDAALVRIWVIDSQQEVLILQASAGLYTHLDGQHSRIPLGFQNIGRIALERKPHFSNSVITDSWVTDPEWAASERLVSFAGCPLVINERLSGVLAAFSHHPLAAVTQEGLSVISTIIANCIVRKQSEQVFLHKYQYLKTLIEASADSLSVLDLKGVIQDTNPSLEKLLGVSRAEIIGKSVTQLVTDPESSIEAFQQILTIGSITDFIVHVRTGSGKVIECSVNASIYRDEHGKSEGVIASLRDVTQRRQEEEKLRSLASIFEHSSDAIFTETLAGIVTSWNRGAERVYGYSGDEIIGKSVAMIVPKERTQELQALIAQLKNGERLDLVETQRLRKDGVLIDVSLSISPLNDADGNIAGVSIIGRDISEKKLLERRLEFNETLFREICTGALDGIVCIDHAGKVTVWNRAAEKLFGYQANEIVGKDIRLALAPAGLSARYSVGMEQFASTGTGPIVGKTIELEAKRADGETVPIELSVSAFKLNGKWNAVGVARDITDRRETQRRLKENEEALLTEHKDIADANKLLSAQAEELRTHGSQMEYLTQLGEFLQVCASDEEAHEVIAKFGGMLFPESSGELLIFKESKNWVVRVADWGEHVTQQSGFPVSECWALRRGQPHLYNELNPSPRCPHIESGVVGCLCVPLVLMGEIFGILHVQWAKTVDQEDEKLVTRLAADAALALTNLRLRKQLKDLSIRDPLTGLFNRRYLEEFFEQELIRSRRKSGQLSVIMVDIDHFKKFNDTYGQEAGDAVLFELGKFFKREMRGSDVTCRYGGEEFILLLPETAVDAAQRRAEQIRKNVKSMQVTFLDNVLPEINLSLGVATFPEHGLSMEELIGNADMALFKAKEEGRDRVCVVMLAAQAN